MNAVNAPEVRSGNVRAGVGIDQQRESLSAEEEENDTGGNIADHDYDQDISHTAPASLYAEAAREVCHCVHGVLRVWLCMRARPPPWATYQIQVLFSVDSDCGLVY